MPYRDDRDDEYIACALIHDIGDTLATFNHPDIGAAILKPFVSEGYHWMVEKHGIFQGYYFFHHLGLDRNLRDQFIGHPYYELCAEFCADYDQPAFDPDYPTMALAEFDPLLRELFAHPKQSIYLSRCERSHIMKAAVFYEIGGPEVFKYEDVDDPVVRPGGLLVEVAAVGIQGGDLLHRQGGVLATTPHVVGYQASGVVARGRRRRRRLRGRPSGGRDDGLRLACRAGQCADRAARGGCPTGSRSRRPPASRSSSARRTTACSSSVS